MDNSSEVRPTSAFKPPGRYKGRLLLLLLFGAFLVGTAAGYLYLTYQRPEGIGPAGPAVPREEFRKTWTKRPVLLVGLGDSVTAGFGARKGYSYFERLRLNPIDDFEEMAGTCLSSVFPDLRATNLAVSGSTSFALLEAQLPLLPSMTPQTLGWIVLTTGGNDLIHNYGRTPPGEQAMYGASWEQAKPWIADFERRLNKIIGGVSDRFPGGCHIFLASIYDPSDGMGDIEKAGLPAWQDGGKILNAYNEIIRRCADTHPNVHIVDLHRLFLGHGIHCGQFWSKNYDRRDPHYWYYTNLEDPNERGYDAIRRLFLLEMAKAAKQL